MFSSLWQMLIDALDPPAPSEEMQYCPACGGTGYDRWWVPCRLCGSSGYVPKRKGGH